MKSNISQRYEIILNGSYDIILIRDKHLYQSLQKYPNIFQPSIYFDLMSFFEDNFTKLKYFSSYYHYPQTFFGSSNIR